MAAGELIQIDWAGVRIAGRLIELIECGTAGVRGRVRVRARKQVSQDALDLQIRILERKQELVLPAHFSMHG